jgi:hypothetical protein
MIAGEAEELGENLPQRHFVPPQIPQNQVRFRTPDRSGGKPATNRLSYGAALLNMLINVYKIYTGPLSVQAQYSRLCSISSSFRYNGSLAT